MLERIKLRGMVHLLTHKTHVAAGTLALALGACGGGGGGGTDAPPNPLRSLSSCQ